MSTPTIECVRGVYPLADDDPGWSHSPRSLVRAALSAGASIVQVRLKHTGDGEALQMLEWAARSAREREALLIVNDRYDLADLAGAGGVHLGQDDLPPERIPAEVRTRLVVGLSTHTLAQVRESRDRPVDYIAFGPVFGTASKETRYVARGVEALANAVALAGRPVVAIGGVTLENVGAIRRAGVHAFAVISAVAATSDPEKAIRLLGEKFESGEG